MLSLGRLMFLLHLPITLALLMWIWVGRIFFGAGGWFLLVIPLMAGPFIAVALLVVEIVTLTTRRRPGEFTTGQTISHVVLWAAMFGIGLCLVDFGDTEESAASAFTQLVGQNETTLEISNIVTLSCLAVAVISWVACLVTGVMARRSVEPLNDPIPSNMTVYQNNTMPPPGGPWGT